VQILHAQAQIREYQRQSWELGAKNHQYQYDFVGLRYDLC
jgi:hypothetical protein